jgi:peptide/nickel transport system permease protein
VTRYIAKRLLAAVPIVLVVVLLNFALVRLAPGDPTSYLIGDSGVSPEALQAIRVELGLDRPLIDQLGIYLGNLAHGDLGSSFVSRQPVSVLIWSRLPATLLLVGTELGVAIGLGLLLGAISASRRGGRLDALVTSLSVLGYAIPVFWIGQLLILLFAVNLHWLPAQGIASVRGTAAPILDVASHLVLPVLTLAVFHAGLFARVTRASMVDVMDQDYVRLARAKGLSETTVMRDHVFRNALIPIITVIGLNFRNLIAGAVLTETLFAWPGVGRLTYDAIIARDYPVALGVLLIVGIAVTLGNLVTDLAYTIADPRVRLG